MISSISFQTKARTVDHLGREQIADTPTAISELWKNSFDAYAREVELNVYDGLSPVASVLDDGHGMNQDEFINRWLVVGTESKASSDTTPAIDRNGLRPRPRQGQKGIGRLSCANLGPTLLFVSKRRDTDFVAALVDWRLFENPFLNLIDIQIPVTMFGSQDELFKLVPNLSAQLLENITGGPPGERRDRILTAWASFDALHEEEVTAKTATRLIKPSVAIQQTMKQLPFADRHLNRWKAWTDEADHGTALLVSELNYDLSVQLDPRIADTAGKASQERLFETLSSFVDPFVDPAKPERNAFDPQFSYAVRTWQGETPTLVLGTEKQFDRHMIEPLEHHIEGAVDSDGVFRGRIKAFGAWIAEECVIDPPKDLVIPRRADTETGPFDVFIASMEFTSANTTHTKAEFQRFQELASRYAGFMMFRDGLRVMPYGRADNDFFEIESRRSRSAGREFWNHRQMFGRLAISRARNPNLKDKAGREGLLDNRAAKTLKALVANILMQSARRYFGSASDVRQDLLPEIRRTNAQEKATEARNKLRKLQRQEFRRKLDTQAAILPAFHREVGAYVSSLSITDDRSIAEAQSSIETFRDRLADFRLPGAPQSLGTLEEKYTQYRDEMRLVQDELAEAEAILERALETIQPLRPRELVEKQIARNAAQLSHRVSGWKKTIDALQRAEYERVRELVSQRNKIFHAEAAPLLHRIDTGELTFPEAAKILDLMKTRIDSDNADIFLPYISALESLKESIDLEHLASFGMDEASELRGEIERLNSLAQLGIAVEIVGHELQSYDEILGAGLRALPADVRESRAAKDIEFGYEGLTDQLRFLSPLRLAGQKVQKWISGQEIADYLGDFFKLTLSRNQIALVATPEFAALKVFEQQSRLLPVFINLVNNSIYWTSIGDRDQREIRLSVVGERVVISDTGPGVDSSDISSLFGLFFTRKIRGGRGVGLYLSRANLAAGGHRISYGIAPEYKVLSGANFVIEFQGANFDAS